MAVVSFMFYFHSQFLNQLKDSHTELYSQLGMPSVFTKFTYIPKLIIKDYTPDNSATKYSYFMAKREWVSLNDPILNKYAQLRRYSQFIGFGLFVVSFVYAGS